MRAIRLLTVTGIFTLLIAAPSFAGGGGGCYEPPSDGHGAVVKISKYCFEPTVLHVETGDSITWVNRDGTQHAVTGASESWGVYDALETGDEVTYNFTKDGVYPYFCVYHPGMTGAVVVGDGSGVGAATKRDVVNLVPEEPEPTRPPAVLRAATAKQAARPSDQGLSTEGVTALMAACIVAGYLVARIPAPDNRG